MATAKKTPKGKKPAKVEKPEVVPFGRPTAYRPEFCPLVVELGRQGKSKAQIAAHPEIDVTRMTLDNWCETHPDFLYALTRAKDLALAKWEDKADGGIESVGFNSGLWGRIMSARFPADYREVKVAEVTGKDGKDLMPNRPILNIPANATPAQIKALAEGLGATGEGYDLE